MFAAQAPLTPLRRCLDGIKCRCNQIILLVCDPYRAELHYMRGPGPKWHAKHNGMPSKA